MISLIGEQTNRDGKAQYGVAFRNKNVEYCPVNAVALYLFYRFHVEMESWPEFSDRLAWYSTKLLAKSSNVHEQIASHSHREVCNTAYKKAGCKYLSGTHTGRHEGCKLAMLDVPDAQMRRLGRWDHSRMTQHYSTRLPRQGARILAGHGADPGMFLLCKMLIVFRQLFFKSRISYAISRIAENDFSTH